MDNAQPQKDVSQLNSFLRGELSAVETYEQALEKVDSPSARSILERNHGSHAQRARTLREEIRKAGGEPADSSGIWGTFAKAIEGGAKLFGSSAAVAALEEGEDHGLADYRRDLSELSPEHRAFVSRQLLPEQQKTHDSLAALKKIMD